MTVNRCRDCFAPLPPLARWCNENCRRREDGPPQDERDDDAPS